MLSDRDLLGKAGVLVPHLEAEGELEPLLVRDAMQAQPDTAAPETTVAAAAAALVEWGIGCLPVTRGRALVGFVTETDLLDALVAASRYGRLGGPDDPPVGESMTPDPETVDAGTTVEEAAQRMRAGDYRHLPIADDGGRLLGIVSDRDLRRATTLRPDPDRRVIDLSGGRPTTVHCEEAALAGCAAHGARADRRPARRRRLGAARGHPHRDGRARPLRARPRVAVPGPWLGRTGLEPSGPASGKSRRRARAANELGPLDPNPGEEIG